MPKKISNKIIITHPRTGVEKKLDTAIYLHFKTAILGSLKKNKAQSFTQLKEDVVKSIRKKNPAFNGSIPWYTITVLLDLEAKDIVETFTENGRKLNRLKA